MAPPATTVARLLRLYPGGSTSPALVETGTGERFVLKLAGAGPGPRALLTEFLAARIAGCLGLAVPAVRPLDLPAGFPWQVGTDEFDDMLQRSYGWNLGVAYVPGARDLGARDLDRLPAGFAARLGTVDRLLQNVDRTRANPNLLQDAAGRLWAIDHGACLFLERIIADRGPFSFALPANHFLAGRPLPPPDPLPPVDPDAVGALVDEPPDAWVAAQPLGRPELARRLRAYVEAFRGAAA